MALQSSFRRAVLGTALCMVMLLLAACTQIPAELDQALLGTTAESTDTNTQTANVTLAATIEAPSETPAESPSETPTDVMAQVEAPLPAATGAATETVTETLTVSATEPAIEAPAFVLPTPTPRPALGHVTDTLTTTSALTETGLLTESVALTETADAPVFVLPTATTRATPTVTPTVTPTETPTETPKTEAMARVLNGINVRTGPGTNYPVIAGLAADARVEIVGRNAALDWWQVAYSDGATGWVSAPLVEVEGDSALIALVTDIPTPPPTATPAPATATASAPAESAAVEAATSTPAPVAAASTGGPAEFRVVNKRLWDVYENGGSLDGPSVTCGAKRQLVVTVVDAGGAPINGVAVQAQYGAREIFITGSQGKGDGNVEFVLGGGQDVTIIRDNDGSDVISEMATGLATHPDGIEVDQLIQARYCTDAQSCQSFIDAPGCYGHFSWSVTFQRNR